MCLWSLDEQRGILLGRTAIIIAYADNLLCRLGGA